MFMKLFVFFALGCVDMHLFLNPSTLGYLWYFFSYEVSIDNTIPKFIPTTYSNLKRFVENFD
jgi:hypothetical protein